MNYGKASYLIIFILLLFSVFLGWTILFFDGEWVTVTFFDVGQGDSILIRKGNQEILVDDGRSGKILLEKLGRSLPFWDRKIEAVIVTHPDVDHIGGLVDVIRNYEVGVLVQTNAQSQSKSFEALKNLISEKNIQTAEGKIGVRLKMNDDIFGEVIYPIDSSFQSETNESSIVVNFDVLDESFLLTGDLPSEREGELMTRHPNLKATVLKAAHHGSKYSTSDDFLNFVKPKAAVISVGKNSYGHPNPETLARLKNHMATILRTDEKGDIIFSCTKVAENDAECVDETSR